MNLIRLVKISLPVFAVFGLVACSSNGSNDYHADETEPSAAPVQVPHDYVVDEMEQDYPIPDVVNDRKLHDIQPPKDIQ